MSVISGGISSADIKIHNDKFEPLDGPSRTLKFGMVGHGLSGLASEFSHFIDRGVVEDSLVEAVAQARIADEAAERRRRVEKAGGDGWVGCAASDDGHDCSVSGKSDAPSEATTAGLPGDGWVVKASVKAARTTNPIRKIVDSLKRPENPTKPLVNLSLGDPTAYGNLRCPAPLAKAVADAVTASSSDGYNHACGIAAARAAVAAQATPVVPPDDVIIASGASGALELAINVLVDAGDNILVPRPGFPLYQVSSTSDHLAERAQMRRAISHNARDSARDTCSTLAPFRTVTSLLT